MTRVSIIIKALNEEEKIQACIESALAATAPLGGEVILADSLSTDRTVELARHYPIKIVQLTQPSDRSCGAGAQLGYLVSKGDFVYILDGDMTIEPNFLEPALREMELDPLLAGVGGQLEEVCTENFEFKSRRSRAQSLKKSGVVDRLDGGGLYRRSAIEAVGYLTNRYLHSYEEIDLAVRLRSAGYRLKRIDAPAVRHSGHTENSFRLLKRRWTSGYIFGIGEVLRAAWGSARFKLLAVDLKELRVYLLTLVWWLAVLWTSLSAYLFSSLPWWLPVSLFLAPFVLMGLRRGHPAAGVYSVASWTTHVFALFIGFFRKAGNPTEPIPLRIVHE